MNRIEFFEIQASNVQHVKDFYSSIFGWQFEKQVGLPIEYWHITTSGISGGLLQRPAPTPVAGQGTNAFTCSIWVDDFDAVAAKILQYGGTVALPKFAVPGKCWQGYFIDTDNNTFGIFQPDEHAE